MHVRTDVHVCCRFDVSGVHPQNKTPGTYTEVPYCRKATSKEVRSSRHTVDGRVPAIHVYVYLVPLMVNLDVCVYIHTIRIASWVREHTTWTRETSPTAP